MDEEEKFGGSRLDTFLSGFAYAAAPQQRKSSKRVWSSGGREKTSEEASKEAAGDTRTRYAGGGSDPRSVIMSLLDKHLPPALAQGDREGVVCDHSRHFLVQTSPQNEPPRSWSKLKYDAVAVGYGDWDSGGTFTCTACLCRFTVDVGESGSCGSRLCMKRHMNCLSLANPLTGKEMSPADGEHRYDVQLVTTDRMEVRAYCCKLCDRTVTVCMPKKPDTGETREAVVAALIGIARMADLKVCDAGQLVAVLMCLKMLCKLLGGVADWAAKDPSGLTPEECETRAKVRSISSTKTFRKDKRQWHMGLILSATVAPSEDPSPSDGDGAGFVVLEAAGFVREGSDGGGEEEEEEGGPPGGNRFTLPAAEDKAIPSRLRGIVAQAEVVAAGLLNGIERTCDASRSDLLLKALSDVQFLGTNLIEWVPGTLRFDALEAFCGYFTGDPSQLPKHARIPPLPEPGSLPLPPPPITDPVPEKKCEHGKWKDDCDLCLAEESIEANWRPQRRQSGVPCGLQNAGNACYANAVLQAYFSIPAFRRCVLQFNEEQAEGLMAILEGTLEAQDPEPGTAEAAGVAAANRALERARLSLPVIKALQRLFLFMRHSDRHAVRKEHVVALLAALDDCAAGQGQGQAAGRFGDRLVQHDASEFGGKFFLELERALEVHSVDLPGRTEELAAAAADQERSERALDSDCPPLKALVKQYAPYLDDATLASFPAHNAVAHLMKGCSVKDYIVRGDDDDEDDGPCRYHMQPRCADDTQETRLEDPVGWITLPLSAAPGPLDVAEVERVTVEIQHGAAAAGSSRGDGERGRTSTDEDLGSRPTLKRQITQTGGDLSLVRQTSGGGTSGLSSGFVEGQSIYSALDRCTAWERCELAGRSHARDRFSRLPPVLTFAIGRANQSWRVDRRAFAFDNELFMDPFVVGESESGNDWPGREDIMALQDQLLAVERQLAELRGAPSCEIEDVCANLSPGLEGALDAALRNTDHQFRAADSFPKLKSHLSDLFDALRQGREAATQQASRLREQIANLYQSQSRHRYLLQAVVVHEGARSNAGHYFTYVRSGGIGEDTQWTKFDDANTTTQVSNADMKIDAVGFGEGCIKSAFVLLYCKEEALRESADADDDIPDFVDEDNMVLAAELESLKQDPPSPAGEGSGGFLPKDGWPREKHPDADSERQKRYLAVSCPNCSTMLKLTESAIDAGIFSCPKCLKLLTF